jgi:hypothetical protein
VSRVREGVGNGQAKAHDPWIIGILVVAGSAGAYLLVALTDFIWNHAHSHRGWVGYLVFGLLGFGLLGSLYFYRVSTQFFRSAIEMVRSLRWWHWLWTAIWVSGLIFRKRTAAEGIAAPVDSAAMFRVAVVGAVGAIILVQLFLRKVNWLSSVFTGIVGLLLFFDLMTLFSTVWSVYWQWTFYKAIEYGVDVCVLAVCLYMCKKSEDFQLLANWTWVLYGIMLLNIWFGCVWDPKDALMKGGIYGEAGIGGLGVWLAGVFPDVSSNDLAEYAACLTAVALCRLLPMSRKRVNTAWYVFLFLAGFTTIIFGQTRSALAGFCLAVFLVYLLSGRFWQGASIVMSSVVMIIVTGFYSEIFDYLKRGQSENQLDSFSSRLQWWTVALEKFSLYPFTGLGMWAAARFGVLAQIGFTQTATIHSDWVEIIVGTGAWGFLPILLLLIVAWWVLVRTILDSKVDVFDRQIALEGMAVLAVVFTRMFFMTDLSRHPPSHFFIALGAAEFLRRKLKRKEAPEYFPAQLAPQSGV